MPTKSTTPRLRENRAWGSRFDSLDISPSTVSSPNSSPKKSHLLPHSDSAPIAEKETSFLSRSWADDDVPATMNSSQSISDAADPASDTSSVVARRDAPRLPHAASVFVGSLPTNVDETELSQSLHQHLSNIAKIHGIKIIHDNKGGVCAFVQCESASQASDVISRSQTAPQLFMGRYLRFESARAFRSLWISYRTPMSFIPGETKPEDNEVTTFRNENKYPGRWVKGEVPKEMRIWWPKEARYPIVTYGPEARNMDTINKDLVDAHFEKEGSLTTGGVYFDNITLDANIMHEIVSAFGPLESFELCKHFPTKEDNNTVSYPVGHDALRDPNMDGSVWEVKWEHRDDCVCALNTLKRMPFISVTWANQPTSQVGFRTNMSRNSLSPRFQHPLGGRNQPYFQHQENKALIGVPSPSHSFPMKVGSMSTPSMRARNSQLDHPEDSDDSWTVVRPHLQGLGRSMLLSQSSSSQSFDKLSSVPSVESVKVFERSPKWNERDFPPLHVPHIKRQDVVFEADEGSALMSTDPNDSTADADPSLLDFNKTDDADADVDDTKSESASTSNESYGKCSSMRAFSHRRSLSNPIPRNHSLGIPPTPELANHSSLSPTTPASTVPVTPMYIANLPLSISVSASEVGGAGSIQDEHASASNISMEGRIDPKTIFVGGLESTFPSGVWSEEKLRNIFKAYGEIEAIKLVKPSIKKSAFAFVTFSTEDAAQRAVDEEHNRIYNGRSIRVQLREVQPGRFGFKFRRGGRGRNYGSPHIVSADFNPGEMYKNQSSDQICDDHNLLGLSNGGEFERVSNVARTDVDRMQRSKAPFVGREQNQPPQLHSQDVNAETHPPRDPDSRTSVSATPPPSIHSLPVSTGATTPNSIPLPYGYYHHHPWMPPYMPAMPYALPVGHYPGLVPHYPPYPPASSNVSADGTAAQNPALAWNPMYRGPMPYSYPYMNVPQTGQDLSRGQQPASSSTPVKERPPLYPTGFIQGEHGTLIPVYQPDDLNQYMSGNSPTQTSPQNVSSASSQNQTGAQHTQNAVPGQGTATWPAYPPPHQFYAYPSHAAVPSNVSPSSQQQAIHQQVHGHSLSSQWPPVPAHHSLAQAQIQHFPHGAVTGSNNLANASNSHAAAAFYPSNLAYGQPRPSHFPQNGTHQDIPPGMGHLHPHGPGRTPKRGLGSSSNHRSPSNARAGSANNIPGYGSRPDNHRFFAGAPASIPEQSAAPCPPSRAKPGVAQASARD